MPIQIGQKKQVPIYEESTTTVTTVLNSANISSFFTVTNESGTSGWTISNNSSSGLKLVPGNIGVNSTTATVTFVAKTNLTNVNISGAYYTESRYDKITLKVADTTVLSSVSGTSSNTSRWSGSLASGKSIIFKYVKDSSQHATNESNTYFTITCDNIIDTITTSEIVGYEEKLLPQIISNLYLSPTKKVIGGWIKDSSGAKQFYGGLAFEYTGNYTVSDIKINNIQYKLYALTSSGTLKLKENAFIWGCGGGAGGQNGKSSGAGGGGGGGYVISTSKLNKGNYSVIIGAGGNSNSAGGITSIGDFKANGGTISSTIANGGAGGSGGGASGCSTTSSYERGSAGAGAGISTYPFGLIELKAHSAGGGGAYDSFSYISNGDNYARPTAGGWGGSNGASGIAENITSIWSGEGGAYGGGTGAVNSISSELSATFYGAGGGGGYRGSSTDYYNGGSGYQGIIYILIIENLPLIPTYFNSTNLSSFFTVHHNSSDKWQIRDAGEGGLLLQPRSSDPIMTFTAKNNITNLRINATLKIYAGDEIEVKLNNTTIWYVNDYYTHTNEVVYSGNLKTGDVLEFSYTRTNSNTLDNYHTINFTMNCDPI